MQKAATPLELVSSHSVERLSITIRKKNRRATFDRTSQKCKSTESRSRTKRFKHKEMISLSARHNIPSKSLYDKKIDAMSLSARRRREKKLTDQLKRTLSADYREPDPQNIKKILVNTKLIEFSSQNPSTEFLISSWLSCGWYLPSTENKQKYKCKIHAYVICDTLPQCLNYTFQEFMADDWCKQIYSALMMQCTLPQKAKLFHIGSNRKNRKKKIISNYKDCIVGKEGIDWMLANRMAKSRYEAVMLGRKMLAQAYLSHVSNIEDFEDSSVWYHFHEDTINYDLFTNTPAPTIPPKISYIKSSASSNYLGTPSTTNTISIPITPPSSFGNTPIKKIKLPTIIKSKKEEDLIERFTKHNEIMHELVCMALLLSPDINACNDELIKNIENAFYLPSARNGNKYVCKIVDYVSFNDVNDAIEFILTEFWEETFAQTIYDKLVSSLTVAQKCKLLSIGIDPLLKTRKHRLKKYKLTFTGLECVEWLIKARICSDIESALNLGNRFWSKGLIKHITNAHKLKNESSVYYQFNIREIQNQSQHSLCFNPKISPFVEHDKIIQNLISMSLSPTAEIELLLDLQKAFYLPRSSEKYNKFVSKFSSNLVFDNIIEAIHYLLIECWDEDYSQIVYYKLINKLSLAQKAKLFSLGIERKTKKKHFKKYSNCFIGKDAVNWLVDKGFASDHGEATELGKNFWCKGFIKHITDQYQFKNAHNVYYQFNDIEINKQCIMESYNKNVSYVNISPCTQNILSQSASFPNIDYDLNDSNDDDDQHNDDDEDEDEDDYDATVIQHDDDDDEEEGFTDDQDQKEREQEESFPDIDQIKQKIKRTSAIRIKSVSDSHRMKTISAHPEIGNYGSTHRNRRHHNVNTSLLSNIAVHGGGGNTHRTHFPYDSRCSNIAVLQSTTQNTPEFACLPDEDEDEYHSDSEQMTKHHQEMKSDEEDDYDGEDNENDDDDLLGVMHFKKITPFNGHSSMATRVTIANSDDEVNEPGGFDRDRLNNLKPDHDLYSNESFIEYMHLKNAQKVKQRNGRKLLPNLSLPHNDTAFDHDLVTSSDDSIQTVRRQRSNASMQSSGTVHRYHHIVHSTLSSDITYLDSAIYGANGNRNSSTFNAFSSSHTPQQIGK